MTESRIISKSATFPAHGNNYWVDIFLVKEKAKLGEWFERKFPQGNLIPYQFQRATVKKPPESQLNMRWHQNVPRKLQGKV